MQLEKIAVPILYVLLITYLHRVIRYSPGDDHSDGFFFLISQYNNLLYLPLFNTAAFTQLLHDISLLRP